MSSPPSKSITSYFNRLPSTSPATLTKVRPASASVLPPSSPTSARQTLTTSSKAPAKDGIPENSQVTVSSNDAGPLSSPTQAVAGVKRTSFLSDAARKAIREGAAEGGVAKKLKSGDGTGKPVADVFQKAAQLVQAPKIVIPKANTRDELRKAMAEHPKAPSLQLELDTLGEDWLLALQDEFSKPYFLTLKDFVTNEQKSKTVFPPAPDIYTWSRLCPLSDVRVVIIGQDPYHDDGQAHGLAFSVRRGMRIPPSLRNIYKEMHDEEPTFTVPKHGDLTEWAKHGVLLLNTSLTVRAHEAGSHAQRGWEIFTAAVLKVVIARLAPTSIQSDEHVFGAKGVVFMAWGAHAQKMCSGVDKKKHLVLTSAHPSPLAAAKGFFGNKHFNKANDWLVERYGEGGGIDWKALGQQAET